MALLLQDEFTRQPPNIWFPIAFVLIMAVVAALVAAGGDRMGHRAARRKLRIGNMRPRHVSTLIAIITGVLISLVTFGVVFAVWADFRNALLQYDNLNGRNLELTQRNTELSQQIESQEQALVAATQQIEQQGETLEQQGAELAVKTQTITETRAKVAEAQSQLQSSQARLRKLEAQRIEAQRRLANLDAEIARVQDEAIETEKFRLDQLREQALRQIDQLNAEIEDLEAEIARAETGVQIYSIGDVLSRVRVDSSQLGDLDALMEQELTNMKLELSQQGMDFDPGSADNLRRFLATPLNSGQHYVVLIRAGANVFEGDRVLLDFHAEPLAPVIRSGEVVLDMLIRENTARITAVGGITREVSVPAQFTEASLVDFAVEAQQAFAAGARAIGMLPGPDGEIGSPVERLPQIAGEMISRERPLRIQFVAVADATVLDSLADARIYVSNPGANVPEAEPEPEPAPEPPPADDAATNEEDDDATADDDSSDDEVMLENEGGDEA